MDNTICLEAYHYYKAQYPDHVILFHLEGRYECYMQDAGTVEELHEYRYIYVENETAIISEPKITNVVISLINRGVMVKIIEYRDNNGKYNIPKVKQIRNDSEMDY